MTPISSPKPEGFDLISQLDSLLDTIARDVEDLGDKIHSLPSVGPDGSSKCGFAEELYFRKQEAEQKVIGSLSLLQRCLSAVEQQLARCRGNLQVISSHATLLNNDEPKRQFTEAEVAQAREYRFYVQKRERILEMLKKVQEVLAESQRKQYPGGARDRWGTPAFPADAPVAAGRGQSSIGDELEHLLALRR